MALGMRKSVEICCAPLSKNTIRNVVNTIYNGLNLASQDTIIAVKPRPPAVVVLIVWFVPPTNKRPAIPQIAPETTSVLITTFFTLILK